MGWQESFINVAHISSRDLELFGPRPRLHVLVKKKELRIWNRISLVFVDSEIHGPLLALRVY